MSIDFNIVRQYDFPCPIRFGLGAINELAPHMIAMKLSRPLIVTDSTVAELGFFKKIIADIRSKGISPEVYSSIHKNPIKADVLLGGDAYKTLDRDCIVGLGGGAAMDVARAIVLRINHRRDLFDYDVLIGGEKFVTEEVPYFITVPTTSGTGSEVGRSAVISEDDTHRKRLLFSPRLIAKMVFADPQLTADLPPFITAATGMDAFTHHLEACIAKDYHPMCEAIALQGIELVAESLETVVSKPRLELRSKMMIASLMGGVSFQKGLGVVHSMAHPLSSLLDTHHGLANAVLLPYGMNFNIKGREEKFSRIAAAMKLRNRNGRGVVENLIALNEKIDIPDRLSKLGVNKEHIDALSELAVADFCHPNNPRPVTLADFKKLYLEAL